MTSSNSFMMLFTNKWVSQFGSQVGHSLFIPFFLISVGMLVNINLLLTGGTAAFIALSMVTAGMTTKFLAALMTKEILSYTKNEGMLIYGLTVNQAAATLAAVLVGYNIGIFTEPVLTGTIIMILITSLSGSWLTDKYARKIALSKENKPYSSTGRSQRILIPLANPHTAEELMSLAMMMRKKDSHEPLYPLTVVQSGDKTEERIAEAEKLLGSAVVKALSADVPVTPVTRSALDVASGIKQASTDLRISTIIAGWKGSVSSHSRTFGHILDSVKTDSTQMLLISRCINPVNTFKRIILAVPPLFEYQPGFTTAVNSAITLAQQMGVSMSIAAIPDTRRHIRSILEKNQTKIKTEELSITNWNDTPVFIKNNIKKKDELLVLLSVRKGRIAWQPLLSKMPRIITEKIKDINLVVLYPPERPCSKSIISPDVYPSEYKTLLPPHHIQPNLKNTELKKAVYLLLSCGFGHNLAPVMEITRQLTGENSKEPMELTPGALLIHAHITGINSSTAFLGINKNGWKTTYTTEKARVLFILLSPRDATPEIHLKALAYLAGPLHRENAMDKILSAKSAGAISRIFHQKKRSKGKLDNKP